MTNEEVVSIIIPVYNIEKYLNDCILSVCNQTYGSIEIIIVNDGSTDGSSQICNMWKNQDKRIKVIHKENGGLSSARNAGLRHATGKYILFVDGDDTLEYDLLEKTIPHMTDGTEMVSFGYRLTYADRESQDIHFPTKEYLLKDDDAKINFIIGPFFRYEIGWNVWNRVFLKKYIDKFNIEFIDTKKVFAEDQLFCLCYLAHCSKIKMIDQCLYNYVQRDGSIMNESVKKKSLHFAQKNELSKILYEYYDKWEDCRFLLSIHPIVHYMLMERSIQKYESNCTNVKRIRKEIRNDIEVNSDLLFFDVQMKLFQKQRKILLSEYSILNAIGKICRAKEVITGNSILYRILVLLRKFRRV